MQTVAELDRELRMLRIWGQYYRRDMEEVLGYRGVDLRSLLGRGAACLDVHFGPEVLAYGDDVPTNRFFVSEPGEDQEMWGVLQSVVGGRCQLMDGGPDEALQGLQERGVEALGLISWTNIYPTPDLRDRVERVLVNARGLLHPEGLMVITGHQGRSGPDDVLDHWLRTFKSFEGEDHGMNVVFWDRARPGGTLKYTGEFYLFGTPAGGV